MAFGFPAYHEETIDLEMPRNEIISFLKPIIGSLSWSIIEYTENHMLAITPTALTASDGEKIRITILPSGSIHVRSECEIFTQCFDWGKNKKNVHKLLSAISGILSQMRE
jgi:hypothetical protein